MINIDISDVNDNPPLFSQSNYSLIIQVSSGKWVGVEEMKMRWNEKKKEKGGGGGGCRRGLQWTQREGLTGRNNGRLCDLNVKKQVGGWSSNRGDGGGKREETGRHRLHLKCTNADSQVFLWKFKANNRWLTGVK